MRKKTVILDFDGVLHDYKGWKGATIIDGKPVEGSIEWCKKALERFNLCVLSTRCHSTGGMLAIRKWLQEKGFPEGMDVVETKVAASFIIDDRGFQFRGKFPELDYIQDYVPWNRED